ncbi:fatty acid desaturase [Microbaculum marinum]|uniref:Fatty acid desaturase n=1 Tax=Microbaculum marinum TaxID=1764581 RepID=A0AAW9RX20_9HYPH
MGDFSNEELAVSVAIAASARRRKKRKVEWPTFLALICCYAAWAAVVHFNQALPIVVFVPLAAYCVALHSSLRHEALHGHPTRSLTINEALVFPPLCLIIPYRRFRDTHLKHHHDARLTDPYDDPESWYLAERDYEALSAPMRLFLRINQTLAGRLLIGPPLTAFGLLRHDLAAVASGDREVARAWALHVAGCVPVVGWILFSGMSLWAYLLLASWPGLSLLMLRTFAEHRAHPEVASRTAIIEANPLISFLFLNNNLHYVHHSRPRVPWYELPALFRAERERYVAENGGYGFDGYLELARRHLLKAKEPVAHPFMRR